MDRYIEDADRLEAKIRADQEAASMAESINARAFTKGDTIYFNSGEYQPETREGQWLIAHEMAHVAQGGNALRRKEKEGEQNEGDNTLFVLKDSFDFDPNIFVFRHLGKKDPAELLLLCVMEMLHLDEESARRIIVKEEMQWGESFHVGEGRYWEMGFMRVIVPERFRSRYQSDKLEYQEFLWEQDVPGSELNPEEIYRTFLIFMETWEQGSRSLRKSLGESTTGTSDGTQTSVSPAYTVLLRNLTDSYGGEHIEEYGSNTEVMAWYVFAYAAEQINVVGMISSMAQTDNGWFTKDQLMLMMNPLRRSPKLEYQMAQGLY